MKKKYKPTVAAIPSVKIHDTLLAFPAAQEKSLVWKDPTHYFGKGIVEQVIIK
jgi:hypothetical protein